MDEIKVHLTNDHPEDIHFDGQKEGTAINAFLFLTNVPTDPPAGHILAFGNSDLVGKMIFNFWRNSVAKNPEGAFVLEQVARDIVKAADEARGADPWPGVGDGVSH